MSASTEAERRERYLKALLLEREGLVARGLWERVAQIDEQLGAVVAQTPVKRAEKRPKTQRGDTR